MRLKWAKSAPVVAFAVALVLIATGVIGRRTDRVEDSALSGAVQLAASSERLTALTSVSGETRKLARIRKSSALNTALFDGRIRAGDSLSKLLKNHPGAQVEVLGDFTMVWYSGEYYAPSLTAKAGRLVHAEVNTLGIVSSTYIPHVFFDLMTPDDRIELRAGQQAAYQRKLDKVAALRAVVGTAATSAWPADWFMWQP